MASLSTFPEEAAVREVFDTKGAREYLLGKLGSLAPTVNTLNQWARPSWRRRNGAAIRRRRIPKPGRTGPRTRLLWARLELDLYVGELAKLAEAQGRFASRAGQDEG